MGVENATVIYRSSSGGDMKVFVKQVTSEKVKVLFRDGKTWKAIPVSQVVAKNGPLRPCSAVAAAPDLSVAAHGRTNTMSRSRSRRNRRAVTTNIVEVVDDGGNEQVVVDSDDEGVQVL